MGAAPKLPPDPTNQEAKKLVSVLSSQSVRFPSGSEKVFLAASEFEATRYANLDEILNAPALMRPGVVILEVAEDMDVVQAHSFLKAYEGAFAHGRLKAIVLTSIRHEDVRGKFKNYSVADFLIHPMPDRTFLFKVDLQFKIIGNQLESETMKRDPEFDLHSAQKKRNGKFALKVIGPSPSRGEWQMVNQSPTGAVRWRWVKKPAPTSAEELEKELKKGEWLYEGEKEPVWKDEEKLWEMESADPVLEKLANGKKAFSSVERGWTSRAVQPQGMQKAPHSPHHVKPDDDVSHHRAEAAPPTAKEASARRKESLPSEEGSGSRNDKSSPSQKSGVEHSKSPTTPLDDRRMKQAYNTEDHPSAPSPLERKTADAVKAAGSAAKNTAPNSGDEPGWEKQKNAPATTEAQTELKNRISANPVPVAGWKRNEPPPAASDAKNPKDNLSPASLSRENQHDNSKPEENAARLSDKRQPKMPDEPSLDGETATPHQDADEKTQKQRENSAHGGGKSGDSEPPPPLSPDSPPMRGLKQKNGSEEKTNAPSPSFSAPDEIRDVTGQSPHPEPVARAKRSPDPAPDKLQREARRGASPDESKKLPSTAPGFDDRSKGAVAVSGGANRQAADLKERHAGKIRDEEEIRLQATSTERASKEKNLYKVVQERVHYFKSLEEMRDDSSTWERVEAYRVYIAASKKYYGVQSIQELLPVWIYVGEAAPEFIEDRKSWLFWDRMPVEYHSIEEIPAPVLNYFLDLRNRDVMRRIEETRIRNLKATRRGSGDPADDAKESSETAETSGIAARSGNGERPPENTADMHSLPRSGGHQGERDKDDDEMKVGRVEHVKRESLAERIIGFLGALFSRRR